MEKVLIILPDNNKGKYIAKGYSDAFKAMSYFVIERKLYDLNVEEIKHLKPHIIFTFWSVMKSNAGLKVFFNEYYNPNTLIIHTAELLEDIPNELIDKENTYCFTSDSKKKNKIMPAINPENYKRKFTGYKYSLTFAGNPANIEREKILAKLIYNFGIINIFCRSFDFYKSVDEIYRNKLLDNKYIDLYRESYRGYVESTKELSYIYSHSKVNIDLISNKNKYINYRCLEILASGGFLITPFNKTIVKYFEDGKELETYKTDTELTDKIRFYLNNSNLGFLIASKGKVNAVSNHSFYDRLKMIMKVIYGKNSCS